MADADIGGSTKGWLDRVFNIFTGEPQNQKQLLDLLKNLHSHQLFGADELNMIEGVLQVADLQVRDIMIPRGQMVVLDHEDSFPEILEKITGCGHSRFPVIDDDKDDVVGILLAKDCSPSRSIKARISKSTSISARRRSFPRASASTCC